MSNKRKSMSKRLRFSVFARDQFTCRYCGRQSDKVELVIDHVLPVCHGGTNDEQNLVTSCVECNQGKADRKIDAVTPTETDRLRMLQEMNEQVHAAKVAAAASKAVVERMQAMVDVWCSYTGNDGMHEATAKLIFCIVQEYGETVVYEWIKKAAFKFYNRRMSNIERDITMCRYVCGIRRNVKKNQQIEEMISVVQSVLPQIKEMYPDFNEWAAWQGIRDDEKIVRLWAISLVEEGETIESFGEKAHSAYSRFKDTQYEVTH